MYKILAKLLVCGVEVSIGCIIFFKYDALAHFIELDLISSQVEEKYEEHWIIIKEQFNWELVAKKFLRTIEPYLKN